jgi:hypothetical protein
MSAMSSLQVQQTPVQPHGNIPRWLSAVMVLAAGLIVVCCGVRLVVSWRTYGDVENEAGIWTTIAQDASHGMLYRPLESDLGYGGTRYAPLHPLLHAGLMMAGLDPVTGGFLLGLASAAAAMGGFYALMRRLEVRAFHAGVFVCFFMAAVCVRWGILAIKADLLAVALDAWGLVAATFAAERPAGRAWPAMLLAALCFVLAAASKVTSIFGIATVTVWFALHGQRKKAIQLAAVYVLGILLAVLAVQWASQGRAISVFRACAGAGGGLRRLAKAPGGFFLAVFSHDKAVGGFWSVALLLLLARRKWADLTTILLIFTSLGTLAIFGSRGTDINHLIDLGMASLLLLAVQFRSGRISRIAVPLALSAMVIHAAVSCIHEAKKMAIEQRRHAMEAALIDAGNSPVRGPLLSENPMLPILAGNRPYMLDAFMFSVIDVENPRYGQKLRDDVANQRFGAVIVTPSLTPNAAPKPSDPWPEILIRLKDRYELRAREGMYLVYLPKTR